MPRKTSARANKKQRRTAFLIHYDGYIEVLDADSLNPEEEFEHVNDVASRLVKERLHGDVLIRLPDPIPWLAALDADTLYTSEQLLTLARRHSPAGLERTDGTQSPQPPIKILLTLLRTSHFLPEFQTLQAWHDHTNCGDSCRHLAHLPRHPAVAGAAVPRRSIRDTLNEMNAAQAQAAAQPQALAPAAEASVQAAARALAPAFQPPVTAPPRVLLPPTQASVKAAPSALTPSSQAPVEATPLSLTPSTSSVSAQNSTKDAQMVPLPVYVTANSVMPSLSGESSSTVISTVAVDVHMTDQEVTSRASSPHHAPKRQSMDHFGGMIAGLSNGEHSLFVSMPGADSDDDREPQKRLRTDEPAAACEAREPRLSESGSDSAAALDNVRCDSHDLLLKCSVLEGTRSLSPRHPDRDIQSHAPMATDLEEVEDFLPSAESPEDYVPMDTMGTGSSVDFEPDETGIMPNAPAPTAGVQIEERLPEAETLFSSPVPTATAEVSGAPEPTAAAEAVEGSAVEAIVSEPTEAIEPVEPVDDLPFQAQWDHLNGDVLQNVFQKLSCQDAIAASGVCQYWKSVALQDRVLLESLDVRLNEQRPFRSGLPCPENMGLRLLGRLKHMQVPRLVQVAADSTGNGTACMLCANVCEIRGDYGGAVRMWKRAAKSHQPIAMYKLGHHLYKGDLNTLGRNVEDSVMWLTRFQRCVSEKLYAELATCGWTPESAAGTPAATGPLNNTEVAAQAHPPVLNEGASDEGGPQQPAPVLPNQVASAGPDPQIATQHGPDRSAYAAGGHIYFRGNRAITHPSRTSLRARLQAAAEQRQQRAHNSNSAGAAAPANGAPVSVQGTPEDRPAGGAAGNMASQVPEAQMQPQGTGIQQQGAAGAAAVRPAPPPRLQPESEKLRRMLVDALIILGYLHLDGEGTKRDNREAVNAMRKAAELGSEEARRTLGWMYNTGQFGE